MSTFGIHSWFNNYNDLDGEELKKCPIDEDVEVDELRAMVFQLQEQMRELIENSSPMPPT